MFRSAEDISLPGFLKIEDRDKLRNNGLFNGTISGVPYTDDELNKTEDATEFYTGNCDCLDLSKEEDRTKYADLCARFITGKDLFKLWEEHVKTESGSLLVYITYIERSLLSTTTINRINSNE